MPAGIANAYFFQVFNSMSFTIVLGATMMLYFKKLGASAAVVGIVAALPNLMNLLQIPAASFVEKIGYRKFVLRGWSTRSVFVILMSGIAFLPGDIDAATRACLMLFILFIYNTSRGISACGFLPWITQLVPDRYRGQFISRDQMSAQIAALGTNLLGSFVLSRIDGAGAFGFLFFISFLAACGSLYFLNRIPDAAVPEASRNSEPVPWGAIVRYRPFQKLVVYNAITLAVFGGCAVLYVNMCRDKFLMKDSDFLLTMVIVNAVFIPCCLYFGKLVDLSGSKPMLMASAVLHIIHFAVWTSVAAGLIPFNWWVIGFQSSIWAVGYSMFIIANTRLAMSIVPAMGRSHFFAVFSVSQSIVGGLIPVVWGIMLDSIGLWHGGWAGWSWNSFSIMYALGVGLMAAAILALRVVHEEKTMTTEDFFHEVMVASPTRVIARIFSRNRTPQV